MPGPSSAQFIEQLRDGSLLDPARLTELERWPEAQNPDPRALARRLLQTGWLTRFQINQVAQGRAKDLVIGPYIVLDRIGEGAMGQVYKARHQHMNRLVALKVIRKEKLGNPEAVRRFYQEVQAAAQLAHPNIVLAFDAGQAGATHFLAMEYVDGTDLGQLVRESGPLPVARACEYIRQAALGLQHAFERGLIHRDIKPHNLLVARPPASADKTGNGTAGTLVKILDMGLARLQAGGDHDSALTQEGVVMGTPDYLAPEQATNARNADIRSDLYSLGCTFYYLLTGKAPFHGGALTEILLRHQMDAPPPLDQLRPDVPPALAAVVSRLLAKNPADRFQAPVELAEALAPFRTGDGDLSTAASSPAEAPGVEGFVWDTSAEGSARGLTDSNQVDLGFSPTGQVLPASLKGRKQDKAPAKKNRLVMFGVGAVLHLAAIIALVVWLTTRKSSQKIEADADTAKPASVARGPRPTSPATKREQPASTEPRVRATNPQPVTPDRPTQPGPPLGPPPPPSTGPEVARGNYGEVRRFGALPQAVRGVAFSPDGERLWASDAGAITRSWNVNTGKEINQFKGPATHVPALVDSVAFSADGRRLLYGRLDGWADLWDVEAGKPVRLLEGLLNGYGRVTAVALSPDGRRALVGNARFIFLADVETGKPITRLEGHTAPVRAVAFSGDGTRALSASQDHTLRLWELAGGSQLQAMPGHNSAVLSAGFAPDGRLAVSGGGDGQVRVWDLDTGKPIREFRGHNGPVNAVAFSPDGRLLASGSDDRRVKLWDWEKSREMFCLEEVQGGVTCIAFSPDGRQIACGRKDRVSVWRPADFILARTRPRPGPAPKSPAEASVSTRRLPVPDGAEQQEKEKLVRDTFKADYARKTSAEQIALAKKLVEVGQATNDKPVERFVLFREARDLAAGAGDVSTALKAIEALAQGYDVDPLAMKVDVLNRIAGSATTMAVARPLADQYFALVDQLVAKDDYATALSLLAQVEALARKLTNGLPLLNQAEARTKFLREVQAGYAEVTAARATLKEKPTDPAASLAVGKFYCFTKGDWERGLPLLAAGTEAAFKTLAQKELGGPATPAAQAELGDAWYDLAKTETGPAKLSFQRRAYFWYEQAVAGLTGITKTQTEKRIKELEAVPGFRLPETAGLVRTFEGHTGEVRCLAVSRDGRIAVSGGTDQLICVWDLRTGKEMRRLEGVGAEVRSVALSADGSRAVAGSTNGLVTVWDVDTGRRLQTLSIGTNTPPEAVAMTPDGQRFLYSNGRGVGVWECDGQLRSLFQISGRLGPISSIAVSPNGRFALLGSNDGTVHVSELVNSGKSSPVRGKHLQAVLGVAFSPDGRLALSGSADRNAVLWDIVTGKLLHVLKGHTDRVTSVAFSPDGTRFATGSADRTVHVWDVKTQRTLAVFEGHSGEVTGVAFTADGNRVLSASMDKTLRLWRLSR